MAVLKGIDGSFLEIKPKKLNSIWISSIDISNSREVYSVEIEANMGGFNLKKYEFNEGGLHAYIEYTPFILSFVRIYTFLRKPFSNITTLMFLSSYFPVLTQSIMDENLFRKYILESLGITAVILKRKGNIIDHTFVFTVWDEDGYFTHNMAITVKSTKEKIRKFYASLLKEINEIRVNTIKKVVEESKLLEKIMKKMNIYYYKDISRINDSLYQLYEVNLTDELVYSDETDIVYNFDDFVNFIKDFRDEDNEVEMISPELDGIMEETLDNEEDEEEERISDEEIAKIIEDYVEELRETDPEAYENSKDFYLELAKSIRDGSLERIDNENDFYIMESPELEEDLPIIRLDNPESEVNRYLKTFHTFLDGIKDGEERYTAEKEFLKDLISQLGIKTVRRHKKEIEKIFKFINVDEFIGYMLKDPFEKRRLNYRKWYTEFLKTRGKKIETILSKN